MAKWYILITGALALSVCTTTSTQSTTSWDNHNSFYVNTVPASVEVLTVKEVKAFTAATYLKVPEAPAMAYDVLNEYHEHVVRFVEPKCNSPGYLQAQKAKSNIV